MRIKMVALLLIASFQRTDSSQNSQLCRNNDDPWRIDVSRHPAGPDS